MLLQYAKNGNFLALMNYNNLIFKYSYNTKIFVAVVVDDIRAPFCGKGNIQGGIQK